MQNHLQFHKLKIYEEKGGFDGYEAFAEQETARFKEEDKTMKKKKERPGQAPKPPMPNMPVAPPKPAIKFTVKKEKEVDISKLIEGAKDKDIEVPDQTKEALIMIFIGHVDAGKSTIAGSILIASNKIPEADVKKLKEEAKSKNRESWYMAYINDCLDEERERGKTVEMGRIDFELARKKFTIFDCPGHRNYVQNMMTGAAQADVAALIISARTGEFEAGFEKEGQTREHAMLARAVGVTRLVVVVNKMDSVDYSKDRFDYIKNNLEEFLIKNCGFEKDYIYWVVVSGLTGAYIKEKPNPSPAPWYKGKTLLETLDELPPIVRSKENFLRIPILDKLKDEGELMIYGKVENGKVYSSMECVILPTLKTFTVNKVENCEGKPLVYGNVGESITLVANRLEESDIKRGYVICGTNFWPHICRTFEAEIKVFQLPPNQTITPGFEFTLHLHTIMEDAYISKIISKTVEEDNHATVQKANILKSGERGVVHIKIKSQNPICVEKMQDIPQMGRFVIRKESATLAAGSIVRVKVLHKEITKKTYFHGFHEEIEEVKPSGGDKGKNDLAKVVEQPEEEPLM